MPLPLHQPIVLSSERWIVQNFPDSIACIAWQTLRNGAWTPDVDASNCVSFAFGLKIERIKLSSWTADDGWLVHVPILMKECCVSGRESFGRFFDKNYLSVAFNDEAVINCVFYKAKTISIEF